VKDIDTTSKLAGIPESGVNCSRCGVYMDDYTGHQIIQTTYELDFEIKDFGVECNNCKQACANSGKDKPELEPPAFCKQMIGKRTLKVHFFQDDKTSNIGFRIGYSDNLENSLIGFDSKHGHLGKEEVAAIEQFIEKMIMTANKSVIIKPSQGDIITLNREARRKL
jgi:hypothetical protein